MRAISVLLALAASLAGQQQSMPAARIMDAAGGISPFGQVGMANGQPQAPVKTDCAADGYVVNAITGEPIARARITLTGGNGQSSAAADSSGHWSFSNVACGQVQLMANRPGFLNTMGRMPIMRAPFHPVVLTSGSPVHDIKIPLTPQAVIVGKVVDDQGDPIMYVQVTALSSRVVEGRRTFQPTGNINTNDLGEFRLAGLNPGKYIVCARGNAGGPDSSALGESCYPGPVEGGAASATELAAGRETRVDFTLHEVPTVHVRGTITGMPKNLGAGITLVKRGNGINMNPGPGGPRPGRIGPDGKFDVAGVMPGSYMLSTDYFEAGNRLSARVPVDVGNSDVDGVAVHLDAGFAVTGTVRIESKSGNGPPPNQQFNVNLRSVEPMAGGGQIKWNADHSTFTIADLTPGTYRLDAFPQGQFFVKSATLAGRDILREEIPITQSAGPIEVVVSDDAGTIDAQVAGADDQPLASWVMVLQDGQRPRNAMTGPDGHIRLQGLAPGDYRVYAWDDFQQVEYADPDWMQRYGGSGATVSVQAGQTAQVALKQQTVPAQ